MKHLVVGHLGLVGSAVFRLLTQDKYNIVDGVDLYGQTFKVEPLVDFIHICISYMLFSLYTMYLWIS